MTADLIQSVATTHYRNSPGAIVFMACVVADVLMIPLGGVVRYFLSMFANDQAAGEFLGYLAIGILGAQLGMLAIWLCLLAASLFWILLALMVLVVLVMQILPASPSAPSVSMLIACVFLATLPLAAMSVAGFRVVRWTTASGNQERIAPRFSLRSLFFWTFVVAAVLAFFQWLPAAIQRLQFLIGAIGIAAISVATLWAALRPGPVGLRLAILPTTALLLAMVGSQRLLGWGQAAMPGLLVSGAVYILALAGLLSIYRRAGMRLVHKNAVGWLVQ